MKKAGSAFLNDEVARPFVDDFYRADNRWGPKPRYSSAPALDLTSNDNAGIVIGDQIQNRPELHESLMAA